MTHPKRVLEIDDFKLLDVATIYKCPIFGGLGFNLKLNIITIGSATCEIETRD